MLKGGERAQKNRIRLIAVTYYHLNSILERETRSVIRYFLKDGSKIQGIHTRVGHKKAHESSRFNGKMPVKQLVDWVRYIASGQVG